MPDYQFRCPSCHFEFEGSQDRNASVGLPCPSCGTVARRLLGGLGGFVMKHGAAAGSSSCHGHRPADGSCRLASTGTTCCGARQPCGRHDADGGSR